MKHGVLSHLTQTMLMPTAVSLVRKGIVQATDIKFPLAFRAKSFSLAIVSDAVDYLSPKLP